MSLPRITMLMQMLNTFLSPIEKSSPTIFVFFFPSFSSRSEKRMKLVANISFSSMFVMYLLTAIFGYLTFYGKYAVIY